MQSNDDDKKTIDESFGKFLFIFFQNGSLQIASLDSASIIETVQGHEENQSVWAMCITPDRVRTIFLN